MSFDYAGLAAQVAGLLQHRKKSAQEHLDYMQCVVQQAEQQRQMAMMALPYSTEPPKPDGEPCGGCGSRETITHRGARMCPYCRSDR